jgi:predicted nucleic acid-binding protein
VIVDTTLVIDFLRKRPEAVAFLEDLRIRRELETHPAVIAETLQGARDRREQNQIDAFFARFRVAEIEPADWVDSLARLRQFSLSHGVGWHDCLIAATSRRIQQPIATTNDRDFICFGDVQVIRPY